MDIDRCKEETVTQTRIETTIKGSMDQKLLENVGDIQPTN
jgi:hypothetical protein